MNKNRERRECRKNQPFGINENCLYLFNTYFYVASLHVQTKCRYKILFVSMHTTFAFRFYFIFERFTYLLFLNEYTHMRKCVCLDSRLNGIEQKGHSKFCLWEIHKCTLIQMTKCKAKLQHICFLYTNSGFCEDVKATLFYKTDID